MQSSKPFPETLKSLLEMADISGREVTRRCEAQGWGSLGIISRLSRGEMLPTVKAMEHIAKALRITPETFAEYRLLQARLKLDEREIGLQKALKNLAKVEDRL